VIIKTSLFRRIISMSIKIAFIGAGSVGFTRKLCADLLAVPAFEEIEFHFMDISVHNLDLIHQVVQRDIEANHLPRVRLHKTTIRKQALEGASYVFDLARVGGLEAFALDVEIPLKYGIDQCVGDTLCAGGIMYGQRTIPHILEVCADMKAVSAPGALLLNYANPNAMNTWAANHYGKVQTLGLCHGVQYTQMQIAEALGLPWQELDVICAGINHQTWYIRISHQGQDQSGSLLEAMRKHPRFSVQEKVRIDLLERFGYFCTESNGHASEYLAWYRKTPAETSKWIDRSEWIHGETGGYLRYCRELRDRFEQEAADYFKLPPKEYRTRKRSIEHGSFIIEALETGNPYRGHVNLVNRGCITNLPDDSIVEVPSYFDGNGLSVPIVGELPPGPAAICDQSIRVQRLAVLAAVHGDRQLLKQAMMMDPLTGAVCTTHQISDLTDEMLKEQKEWLPQY
jgi:alpha-galactosidase